MLTYNLYIAIVFLLESIGKKPSLRFLIVFSFLFSLLFIGLRDGIGADWDEYLNLFNSAQYLSAYEYMLKTDILFAALSYGVYSIGGDIYTLNLISAFIFFLGIYVLASSNFIAREFFLLALLPYFIIVVAPNYIRQAITLGLFCLSIYYLFKLKIALPIVLSLIAALFHSSGVFALLITLLTLFFNSRLSLLNIMKFLAFLIPVFTFFVFERVYGKFEFYTDIVTRESTGTFFRLAIYSIPFAIYFLFVRNRKQFAEIIPFTKASFILFLICIPLSLYDTIIGDRVAIYTIPAQAIILSSFLLLSKPGLTKILSSLFVLAYAFIQLNIWLMFSLWAERAWIPYNNIIYGIF